MDYYSQHIIASPKLMAMKLNPIFHNITKKMYGRVLTERKYHISTLLQ